MSTCKHFYRHILRVTVWFQLMVIVTTGLKRNPFFLKCLECQEGAGLLGGALESLAGTVCGFTSNARCNR